MTELMPKSANVTATGGVGNAVTKLRAPSTYVTQSRFFSPVFNAAIFDGPIRIYFAQSQEALALKVYFEVQERYSDLRRQPRGFRTVKDNEGSSGVHNVFVMLYPSADIFDTSFATGVTEAEVVAENSVCRILSEPLGDDCVIGVRGPMTDATMGPLMTKMDSILRGPSA